MTLPWRIGSRMSACGISWNPGSRLECAGWTEWSWSQMAYGLWTMTSTSLSSLYIDSETRTLDCGRVDVWKWEFCTRYGHTMARQTPDNNAWTYLHGGHGRTLMHSENSCSSQWSLNCTDCFVMNGLSRISPLSITHYWIILSLSLILIRRCLVRHLQ